VWFPVIPPVVSYVGNVWPHNVVGNGIYYTGVTKFVASTLLGPLHNICIGCNPTYGELIDTFEEVEGRPDAADLLCVELCQRYPHIKIGRPSRLLDTVKRLIAPTRPSMLGPAKLTGLPLANYRRRVWEPRIRSTGTGESN